MASNCDEHITSDIKDITTVEISKMFFEFFKNDKKNQKFKIQENTQIFKKLKLKNSHFLEKIQIV